MIYRSIYVMIARIRLGRKIEFVEVEEGLIIVLLKSLHELRGAGKDKSDAMISGARELKNIG